MQWTVGLYHIIRQTCSFHCFDLCWSADWTCCVTVICYCQSPSNTFWVCRYVLVAFTCQLPIILESFFSFCIIHQTHRTEYMRGQWCILISTLLHLTFNIPSSLLPLSFDASWNLCHSLLRRWLSFIFLNRRNILRCFASCNKPQPSPKTNLRATFPNQLRT